MNSLIKYFGGKNYFTKLLNELSPESYNLYVEGFGGGASFLFSKQITELEVYNDLEQNVYSLFKVINDPVLFLEFKDKIDKVYYSRQIWTQFKSELKEINLDIVERAYRFFFVNRASYNAVGGFSVNLYIRRKMAKSVSDFLSSVDRLEEYHQRLSKVIIENLDIIKLIDKYDSSDTFFYLDPPYVQSTRKSSCRYLEDFKDEQHHELIDNLLNIKGKVILSGYDNDIYNESLLEWNKLIFDSPNSSSKSIEVIWKNF